MEEVVKEIYDTLDIDWIGAFDSEAEALEVIKEYTPYYVFDVISFQKDYPELLTEEEALDLAGGATYDGNPLGRDSDSNKVWWVDWIEPMTEQIFTIDKEHFYELPQDYPQNLTVEDKEIFDAEYPFWKENYDVENKISSKLHKISFKKKVRETSKVSIFGGPGSGRYPKGSGKNPQAEKRQKKNIIEGVQKINDKAKAAGIESVPVKKLPKDQQNMSDADIIKKIGAKGIGSASCSCVSQAMAYVANKYGLDVLDNRGGESRNFFSNGSNNKSLLESLGGTSVSDYFSGDRRKASQLNNVREEALAMIENNSEALLRCQQHLSVVKKDENGKMYYLEIQQEGDKNGWKDFSFSRFGRYATQGGYVMPITVTPISNLDSKQVSSLQETCAYINTAEENQLIKK